MASKRKRWKQTCKGASEENRESLNEIVVFFTSRILDKLVKDFDHWQQDSQWSKEN